MKNKIIRIMLVITCLLTFFGCGKKEPAQNDMPTTKKPQISALVDNLAITFNFSGRLNNMLYKYPENAMTSNVGTYSIMDYMNKDEFVFRIAIYTFNGKDINEVMNNSSVQSIGTKIINNHEWNIYEGTEDNKKVINYAYTHNKDTYTITFISEKDVTNLVEVFMNNVSFKGE